MMNTIARVLASLTTALLAAAPAQSQIGSSNDRNSALVCAVLATYKAAVERLDLTGTDRLFATDSQIYESGGSEGNYANFRAHHLTPELGEFRTFHYEDYHCGVRIEGPIAIATETYRFQMEPKMGVTIERLGVQTSVLKRINGIWQIMSLHSSSRKPK